MQLSTRWLCTFCLIFKLLNKTICEMNYKRERYLFFQFISYSLTHMMEISQCLVELVKLMVLSFQLNLLFINSINYQSLVALNPYSLRSNVNNGSFTCCWNDIFEAMDSEKKRFSITMSSWNYELSSAIVRLLTLFEDQGKPLPIVDILYKFLTSRVFELHAFTI